MENAASAAFFFFLFQKVCDNDGDKNSPFVQTGTSKKDADLP